MPLTNTWLAHEQPDADLPRDVLEERILNLLSGQNVAVIATTNRDGSPVATPVRYSNLGLEIFYTSWNSSAKSRNLRRDPRVSAAIVAPLVGTASSRGTQLFGTAPTIERHDPEAESYWEAFRWQSDHVEQGRPLDQPPHDPLTVITPPGFSTPSTGSAAPATAPDKLAAPVRGQLKRVCPTNGGSDVHC